VREEPAFFPLVREELPVGTRSRVHAAYQALEALWDDLPPGELAGEVARLQSRLLELHESLGGDVDLDVYGVPRGAFTAYPDEPAAADRLGADRLSALRRGRTRH
jgi:hypothetical protein